MSEIPGLPKTPSLLNCDFPGEHTEAEVRSLVCGACQWFYSGYDGNTCAKIRKVEPKTVACIEFTSKLKDPFSEIAKDKFILGLRDKLRLPRYKVADSFLIELQGYIVDDNFGDMSYGKQQDLIALSSGLAKIISHRSRVSLIYTQMIDLQHDIKKLQKEANMWLYSKYSSIRDLKNELMRESAMDRVIPELPGVVVPLEKIIATARYLDEKLDSNERTIRAILSSAEKLWYSTENLKRF